MVAYQLATTGFHQAHLLRCVEIVSEHAEILTCSLPLGGIFSGTEWTSLPLLVAESRLNSGVRGMTAPLELDGEAIVLGSHSNGSSFAEVEIPSTLFPPLLQHVPPMDVCPNEVLLYVFELACDDDGSTGRALSLVSRRFHRLSRDCKYQSIALVGLPRIAPFVATLEKRPKPPRVRHLFLSSTPQATSDGLQPLVDEIQNYRDTCDAFSKVITMVAPTLVTCCIVSHLARMVTLIPVSCPKLVELTLDGPFPTLPYVYHAPYFPSLRSLTFSNFTDYPSSLFDDIANQSPHLEALSFYFAQACRNFSVDLACALETPTSRLLPDLATGSIPSLPSSVKEVIVQAGSNIDPESRNAYCQRSVQELVNKRLIFMQKHDKLKRVKYLPPSSQPSSQNAFKHWL